MVLFGFITSLVHVPLFAMMRCFTFMLRMALMIVFIASLMLMTFFSVMGGFSFIMHVFVVGNCDDLTKSVVSLNGR